MSSSRDSVLLRGESAAQAAPYRRTVAVPAQRVQPDAPLHTDGSPDTAAVVHGGLTAPVAAPQPARPAVQARRADREPVGPEAGQTGAVGPPVPFVERRGQVRRASDMPVTGAAPRLGDVYAEELRRLRDRAHAEGYAAGYAEGTAAAGTVVAEAEAAAAARLADAQARWERRLLSATAALGAAARQLEEAAAPVAEEVRDSVLEVVTTLVEDMLGRELELAASPGLDALRRALTLCPEDAPVVVRLHPDDLAELPADALARLPATITVVGDGRVERAGAVAETGSRRVDAQLGPALERVRSVLA